MKDILNPNYYCKLKTELLASELASFLLTTPLLALEKRLKKWSGHASPTAGPALRERGLHVACVRLDYEARWVTKRVAGIRIQIAGSICI